VRLIYPLLLIACLAGCQHGGANNSGAVRQAVIDRLTKGGYNVSGMDIQIASVQFNGDQADATVSMTAKGQTGGPPMSLPYHLERQSGKWVVTGLGKGSPHGGASTPGMTDTNPHGGTMPPAASGAENPHGGAMPTAAPGASEMPSPKDLPPATKK
jgi:hypothetical protein